MEWAISVESFKESFERWDADASGTISKFEMRPIIKHLFNEGFIKTP